MNIDRQSRSLAGEFGAALRVLGWVCATAESCTGGMLAAAITACPGSSQWFDRGLVTYSNAAKIGLLNVSADTLKRFGAVSEETAMEMAAGVLSATAGVHLAISTTGIAGPGGAVPGKPVGMVCFGLARRASGGVATRAETSVFQGDRDTVRRAAVMYALQMAMQEIAA